MSACMSVTRRIHEFVARYGGDVIRNAMGLSNDHGEPLARFALAKLPKGTWTAHDFVDSDGVNRDRLVRMNVSVTITEGEMVMDWAGSERWSGLVDDQERLHRADRAALRRLAGPAGTPAPEPRSSRSIPDQEMFFSGLGRRVETRVEELAAALAGDGPGGEVCLAGSAADGPIRRRSADPAPRRVSRDSASSMARLPAYGST